MIKLIKLHLYYLFNKTIFIIILLTEALVIFSLLVNDLNMSNYLDSVFPMIKIIIAFVNIYIYSYSVSDNQNYYFYYLIGSVSRIRFILSKIFCLFMISLFTVFIVFFSFLFFGYLKLSDYYFDNLFLIKFLNLLLLVITYGLYGFMASLLIKNNFTVLLVIGLFILGDNTKNIILLPNDKDYSTVSFIYKCLIIVFIVIINLLIYNKRELNY